MRAEQIYDVVQDIMNKSKETDPFRIAESLGIFIRYDELGKLLGMYTISDFLGSLPLSSNSCIIL